MDPNNKMRILTTVLIMLCLVILQAEGQNYIPFPLENASWHIRLATTCDNNAPPDTSHVWYTLHGDTTIHERVYHKLCIETGDSEDPLYEPIGGLREEDRRIYYIGKGFLGSNIESEYLLYDFTKNVGDTIEHDQNGFYRSVILETDSVRVAGQYRKRYKVNNGWMYHYPDYIIEGIGSVRNGLLGHVSDIPTCGSHYWEYLCFSEDRQVLHRNPAFPGCCIGVRSNSMVNRSKSWYTHIHYYMSMSVNTEIIGLGSDTTISDTTYARVLRNETPYGFLREQEGRIFYRLDTDSKERMIYDFSIAEGDTVVVYGLVEWSDNGFIEIEYQCDSIGTKVFNSISRRMFYLSPTLNPGANTESWIEGIGSLSGLLHNYDGRVGGDAFILSCVYHNDSLLYKKYSGDCVRVAVGVGKTSSYPVKLYPNPTEGMIHVSHFQNEHDFELQIYNSQGQLVVDCELGEGDDSVLVPGPPGLYIAVIKDGHGVAIQQMKIIKR
ncbi:MAG: T9SS type A sorting domain-containing protein [Bacteroidota bacterium]